MRALFAAGGTGGHIYPALAVAKELVSRHPDAAVRFVGTARGLETRLVPQAGFELSLIESAGLMNMGVHQRLRGLWLLPKSFFAARRLLTEFRPDVVVGAGGYVTGPVLLVAALSRKPTLVMESNAVPGFTNRRLAPFVNAAAVSFEQTRAYFPAGRAVLTGNPVRREFFDIPVKVRDPARFSLLLFGGSQGARAVSDAMLDALAHLAPHRARLHVTHQTGPLDFARIRDAYAQAGWSDYSDVREYIDDMVSAFAAADVIVSRAGATTSAELMAAGRTAIMVPLPGQIEQRRNAEVLQAAGAARLMLQPNLSGESLAQEIKALLDDPVEITRREQAARRLAKPNAAAASVELIEKLAARK
ncbi:MAG: undecaprenyldiphospho-muramoylpentapeptide beta-N-acetylglucosaminyltransferase [Pyrinomonadaceae bacterium]